MSEVKSAAHVENVQADGDKQSVDHKQVADLLSQHAFSNPQEYIAILQNDFNAISRGHGELKLSDLQIDMNDKNMSATDRAAAAVAADHFGEFSKFNDQMNKAYLLDQHQVDQNTVAFASQMVNNDWTNAAWDTGLQAVTAAMTPVMSVMGVVGSAWAAGSLEAAGMTLGAQAVALAGLATVPVGIAVTGYLGYEAYRTIHDYSVNSKMDTAEISNWLRADA